MSTRREFLAAASVAALPLAASCRESAASPTQGGLALALVDRRFAPSRLVGSGLSLRGVPVRTLDGDDVTSTWLAVVQPIWRASREPIGGLTARAPLFCLEQLAWSHGMRVVHHAEHLLRRDGSAVHAASTGTVPRGPMWPARVAERLAAFHSRAYIRRGPSGASLEPVVDDDSRLLHSWIIAAV